MGREIKRVPLDFDQPLNRVWSGFLQGAELRGEPCPDCKGGQTWAGWWLQTMSYRLSMLAADVREQDRGRPLHPWLADDPYPVTDDGEIDWETRRYSRRPQVQRPSRDILTLISGLSGQSEDRLLESFGCNAEYDIYRAIVIAAGLGDEWGVCTTCEAHGSLERYPGQRADADAWEPTDPPTGDGWQLWETVSEGSPISPVFADAESLAQWLTTEDACWGAMQTPMTIEQARGFVGAGWAPSFIGNAGGIHGGAEYVGSREALRGHWD